MRSTEKNIVLYKGNLGKYHQIITKISPLFVLQGENVIEKSTPLHEVMKGKASAIAFAVIENGKIDCVGVTGKQSDDPNSLNVTTDTLFLIASMTKTVVAYCTTQCLQAYAKRENIPIDKILDMPVDKFFPNRTFVDMQPIEELEKEGVLAAVGDQLGVKVLYVEPKNNEPQGTIGISIMGQLLTGMRMRNIP